MFRSLDQFYNSSEWRGFRASLLVDRLNSTDGLLYCAECRKPIISSYECVAHHVQPLTMQNVNDFSISLNPDNIELLHMRCHNQRHARYGFSSQKKVYFIWGCPCSGKSTFVQSSKGNSDLVVDIDLIWQAITGGELYEKPDALKGVAFLMRDTLLDLVRTRAGNWERAWVIEGAPQKAHRQRRIDAIGAEDIFIQCDKQTAIQRLANDHRRSAYVEQWHGYIDQWFDQYQA